MDAIDNITRHSDLRDHTSHQLHHCYSLINYFYGFSRNIEVGNGIAFCVSIIIIIHRWRKKLCNSPPMKSTTDTLCVPVCECECEWRRRQRHNSNENDIGWPRRRQAEKRELERVTQPAHTAYARNDETWMRYKYKNWEFMFVLILIRKEENRKTTHSRVTWPIHGIIVCTHCSSYV